jgi:polysaccharide pyruvyl transferase WcaK-like protein
MLLDRAARMGLRATVLGSSFSLTPAPSTVAVLRSLPRRVHLYARDDLSHGRMATALGRKIEISADIVFLLKDVAATPELEDDLAWIAAQRNTGARIVAVNANALQEVERPDLVARYVDLISSLLSTAGVSIVLLPHDTRGDRSDVALAGEIRDGLGADLADRVRLVPPRNPGSVKAIVKASDLLITGRMHAAVLGLTSGTPAISFSYQGKFEGLYRHLGLDPASYVFPTQALDDDLPGLLEACTQALDRSGELRMRILEQLPKLQALSRRNVEHLAFPVQ